MNERNSEMIFHFKDKNPEEKTEDLSNKILLKKLLNLALENDKHELEAFAGTLLLNLDDKAHLKKMSDILKNHQPSILEKLKNNFPEEFKKIEGLG